MPPDKGRPSVTRLQRQLEETRGQLQQAQEQLQKLRQQLRQERREKTGLWAELRELGLAEQLELARRAKEDYVAREREQRTERKP